MPLKPARQRRTSNFIKPAAIRTKKSQQTLFQLSENLEMLATQIHIEGFIPLDGWFERNGYVVKEVLTVTTTSNIGDRLPHLVHRGKEEVTRVSLNTWYRTKIGE